MGSYSPLFLSEEVRLILADFGTEPGHRGDEDLLQGEYLASGMGLLAISLTRLSEGFDVGGVFLEQYFIASRSLEG